ncbi:hypothetical protein Leryth_016234 [Lithospermum erythrorhizon]|nr:hypothetical protein Leryth_016234 [Lithospermum erythrorhizon]
MMSLGSSGGIGGPSSSSSSNLSASAPPFTIDRFSSNPNSNSLVHYADATPFAHTWPYSPIPSAPQPEVEPDSTLKTSVPVSSGFGYVSNASSTRWPAINPGDTSSNSSFYVPETRPYQPPFVSHVIPEDSSSLTLGQPVYDPSSVHVSSQVDHNAQMSGVGYMPQWQGVWKGESRHGDQIGSGGNSAAKKLNESSAFVYNNYVNEGPTIQSEDASRGDTAILYGLSTDGIQMASHAGSYDALSLDKSLFTKKHNAGIYANPIDGTEKDGCSKAFNTMNVHGRSTSLNMMNVGESLFSQNLGHLPLESPGMQFQGSNSSYIEFSPRGTFQEPSKCFSNNQQAYGLQELCIPPRGSFVKDPTIPMKPTCTVVIKAPASNTSSAALDTDKIVGNRIASNGGSKLLEIPHLSEENGNFISTRPESTAGSCYTNQTENDGNYWNFFASNSEGAVPPNSQLEGSMDFILSNKPASQITNTNVSYGFSPSFDYVQGSKYAEDSLENNILALDSPCWKGAQDPYSSNNNFIESLPRIQFLKELDQCLDIPSNPEGPSRVASHELSNVNVNFRTGCPANDELPAQTITSHSSCAAKELNPNAAAKEVINCRNPHCSEDGQFLNDSDKPREENKLSNNFLGTEARYSCPNLCKMDSGFVPVGVNLHSGIEDRVTNCSEAADAGAVAYHAAENVLYSPPTQEVCEEHHQTTVEVATNRVDVSALVNAMHSLSEVLHSNCSDDSCELTIENQVSLKRVIRNLDACVSKKIVESTPVSEFMVPQQSTSISTGDGGHHVEGSIWIDSNWTFIFSFYDCDMQAKCIGDR